jgi:hypothetical protein
MKPSEALNEVVKKQLEETFGAGLTARILFSAREIANAPIIGLTKEQYLALIRAICNDERVKNMWGEFGAKTRLSVWEKLVSD